MNFSELFGRKRLDGYGRDSGWRRRRLRAYCLLAREREHETRRCDEPNHREQCRRRTSLQPPRSFVTPDCSARSGPAAADDNKKIPITLTYIVRHSGHA